jgi:hypothetical protein
MALPKDTTILELAKVFGVNPAGLSPAAKKLTKGDLMRLNDTPDDIISLRKFAEHGQPTIAEIQKAAQSPANKAAKNLQLSVDDINSIKQVFGTPIVPQERLAAIQGARTTAGILEGGSVHIYVCCCPCCCAAATMDPNRLGVA